MVSGVAKKCSECGAKKNIDMFHRAPYGKYGRVASCKECRAIYHRLRYSSPEVRDKNREAKLRHRYGITLDQYNSMFKSQRGKCKICKDFMLNSAHIDHCHKTKSVRGLLCGPCNRGLGCFLDNLYRLKSAVKYLRRSK